MPGLYLIAMCDVLGFRNLVSTHPLEAVYEKCLKLRTQVRSTENVVGFSPGIPQPLPVVDGIVFSDTVLFWAPATGAMEILPINLCLLAALTLGSTPIRIGFAFGHCVIDSDNDIYIGRPIVDAYETEKRQEWVGGAFHPSCWTLSGFLQRLVDQHTVVEYPVPLKHDDGGAQLTHALNWAMMADLATSNSTLATLALQEQKAPTKDKVKWQRARAFYEGHRRS